MSLTIEDKAYIIKVLESRRQYFESRNIKEARRCSNLILKMQGGESVYKNQKLPISTDIEFKVF